MKTDGRLVRLFNTKGGISMKSYAADKVRNVVLLGHSGSGKTTYAEAALFYSGATKRFGKVDEGNTDVYKRQLLVCVFRLRLF